MAFTNLIDLIRQVKGLLPTSNGGVPAGGSTGQALVKSSSTDNDVAWGAAGGSGTVTHTAGALDAHKVVIGNGTDDVKVIATGSAGQYVRSGGASADPAMANIAESEVTNLVSDLALKAPLASPTFTGTPAAPTPGTSDNTTKIATTAYVQNVVAAGVPTTSLPAWLSNNPDAYPASASANDDEFDAGSVNLSLWTAYNSDPATVITQTAGRMKFLATNDNSHLRGYHQPIPAGSWSIITKVALEPPVNANNCLLGLILIESATNKAVHYGFGLIGSTPKREIDKYTDANTFSSTLNAINTSTGPVPQYLKITFDGTNYVFSASVSGIAYFQDYTNTKTTLFTAAADRFGVVFACGKAGAIDGYLEFFRKQ